jgi:hypothetical protein
MHLFGDTSGLWTLPARIAEEDPSEAVIDLPVFCYERPGDVASMGPDGIVLHPATGEEHRPPEAGMPHPNRAR